MTAQINLTAQQNAAFHFHITWADSEQNPYEISGYHAKMQVRYRVEGPIIHEVTHNSDVITHGKIFINETTGSIRVAIPDTVTKLFPRKVVGVYDLILAHPTNSIYVYRIAEGTFTINEGVTL